MMIRIIILIILFINNSYAEEDNLISSKILKVIIDPLLSSMFLKFADNFHGQISFTKTLPNNLDGINNLCRNKDQSILITRYKLNDYEKNLCLTYSQTALTEIKIGYYAFVLISNKNKSELNFSRGDLFKALSEKISISSGLINNPNNKWNDIDKLFPNELIKIYGPFPDSAAYEYLMDNIIVGPCMANKYYQEKISNFKILEKRCRNIRVDSTYIGDTSDAKLIIQKMLVEGVSYGIVSYNIYENYKDNIKLHSLDGINPSVENICAEEYGLSFPIYIYLKNNTINDNKLVNLFLSEIQNLDILNSLKTYGLIMPLIQ